MPQHDVHRLIELSVIGADWGASGYTTLAQAQELGRLLALGPGRLLLDIGAGRGWPGLYLAATSGCSVLLTDLTLDGLRAGLARARAERLAPERARALAASASRLPLAARSVDAVVGTDVLC